MPVIDIHSHMGLHPLPVPGHENLATPEQLIAIMDRCGVDKMCILPLTSPEALPDVQSNPEVFAACDRRPDRFIKFCCVDPRIQDNSPTHDFVPMLQYYKDAGCKGMGEFVANLWWDDPRVQRLLEGCQTVGLPVTFHIAVKEFDMYGLISEPGLPGLERALKKFPRLQFLGHSQAFWSEVGPVSEAERGGYPKGKVLPGGVLPRLFREYPNLWGDMSAGSGCNAVARDPEWGYRFMEEFQDRLLFGLDICAPSNKTPLVDFMREAVAGGSISHDIHDKIMGENAVRVLGL